MATVDQIYTADSLNKYKTEYNNYLSQGMSSKDALAKARNVLVEQTPSTPSNTSNYQNQGAGNYVYNEQTGYYEQTPSNTPTTPTPEVKQEVKQEETAGNTTPEIQQQGELKPLSQEYYNQTGDAAQKQIRDNLNGYRQSNPELFSDYDTFKRNFSYDARNEEQKQTLDNWYYGYEKGMQLSSVPTTELYTQYKDGQVSVNDLENLRISNPTKYAELQNQINKGNIISAYDDDKGIDGTGMSLQDMAYNMAVQTFNKFMMGDGGSEASKYFADYKANMDSPEMLGLSDQCTEIQEQMENIQSDLDSIKKQVEKEYEGTGASRSKINAIISDRSYELQLQLRTLNSEYNKYATQYNNRMNQYQNEFQMQLQEYQINQDARNQQMKELGFAMDLMNFETNEQKAQREWDYWVMQQEYTNGNINSKDYSTRYKAALNSVQNLLSQYEGIPMQRSAEQMADDILKAIDNGSNLGAELTKINQQIQGKPEYKQLYNNTFGTSDKGIEGTYNIGGTEYVMYNGQLMTSEDFNKQHGAKGKANYNVVSEDVLKTYSDGRDGTYGSFMANSKYNDGNYIGQCGKFVNDYLEHIGAGKPFGNETIDVRENWVNSDEGKVGTVALFDYNHYIDGKNYGHVGIVISAPDKNGDFWVKDANFGSDGKMQTRKVNLKDVSLKGFIDPSRDQNGNRVSAGTNTLQEDVKLPGGLTTTGVTQLAKDILNGEKTYSEIKAAYGDEGLNLVENKMLELQSSGFERSTKITDPVKLSNLEKNWRDFYDKKAKEAQETLDWVNKMEEAYNLIDTDKNAASQAITIAYNKILDPGSVVREGEYARSAEGQSYLGQIQAKLEKMKDGGAGLTKKELESMINVAKKFSQNAEKIQLDAAKQTKVAIDKYGLTPEIALPVDVWNKLNFRDTGAEVNDLTIGMPLTGGATGGGETTTTGGYNISSNWNTAQ